MDLPIKIESDDDYKVRAARFMQAYLDLRIGEDVEVRGGVVTFDDAPDEPAVLISLAGQSFPFSVEEMRAFIIATSRFLQRHPKKGIAHLVKELQNAVDLIDAMDQKPAQVN